MDALIIVNTVVASPGEENTIKLYSVPKGYVLRVERVAVSFPRGSGGKVKVQVRAGNLSAYPDIGYFSGDGYTVEVKKDKEFSEDTTLALYYKNEDDIEQLFTYVIEGTVVKSER